MGQLATQDTSLTTGDDVQYNETGLTLDPGMEIERWMEIGNFLGSIHRASSWFLGDWILFGEAAYGEMYSQAVDDLGLEYKTCANTVYVCRAVSPAVRRSDLSFSHHAEIAKLKPTNQRRYLALAKKNGWTKVQLREAIKNGGALPEGWKPPTQPTWSQESGIHPGGSDPLRPDPTVDEHAEAQAESPGQQIPGVSRPARGEVLPPPGTNHIPESPEEVFAAAQLVADAAIVVVQTRGKQGIHALRQALVQAGFMEA